MNQRALVLAALCGSFLAAPASAQTQAGKAARDAGLTADEKLARSAEHLVRMKGAMQRVLARVEEARNEKDVVKLNCVNEKLTQVKGLLKVAEQSDVALHEAIANKDPSADAEFAKVGIARTKIEGLQNDADQCIGQLAYVVDEKTTVEVQQPAGLANRGSDDRWRGRGYGSLPPAPPVRRPQSASTFQ
ncbi:MAG TPA: hypothetical protein VFP50_00565 [Anaeromyxobacteraceae bacterium]|nr:hypothetical protein [Anaeromyxobacteraceae bacterium]